MRKGYNCVYPECQTISKYLIARMEIDAMITLDAAQIAARVKTPQEQIELEELICNEICCHIAANKKRSSMESPKHA